MTIKFINDKNKHNPFYFSTLNILELLLTLNNPLGHQEEQDLNTIVVIFLSETLNALPHCNLENVLLNITGNLGKMNFF